MKNRFSWKQITILAVAIAVLIGLFTVPGAADDDPPEVNPVTSSEAVYSFYVNFYEEEENGESYLVIGKMEGGQYVNACEQEGWGYVSFVIPQYIAMNDGRTLPIKKIAPNAFSNEARITDISFYDGLVEIGAHAFDGTGIGNGFSDTGTVNIPSSVTTIGEGAFANCKLLKAVTAEGSGALTIGAYAFANCIYSGDGSITDPENHEIRTPSHLDSVTISRPVTIGAYAFSGCHVSSLSIPQVSTIGDYAFQEAALTAFEIPATLTIIGANAFSGNNAKNANPEALKVFQVTSQDGGTAPLSIGAYAFSDNTENLGVTIASLPGDRNVTIGAGAFKGNGGMDALQFGKTVSVGDYAFANCGSGNNGSADWPTEWITSVGEGAFDHCRLLGTVDASNVTAIGDYGFRASSINALTLPAWATVADGAMGDYAFAGLDRLTTVTVPSDWPTLPTGFFKKLDGENQPAPGLQTVILQGATAIGNEAFKGCTNLVKVSGETVPSVGESAFEGCTALNKSGDAANAFSLPAATSIDKKAFYGCTGLRQVSINAATAIGESAFENDNGMTGLSMNAAQTIGVKAFKNAGAGSGSVTSTLAWPNTVTSIGAEAFYNCTLLSAVTMANNIITHIGASAFENSSLTGLSLPASQPSSGYGEGGFASATRIFANCDALAANDVTIPSAWTLVPEETFYDCDALPTITVNGAAVLSKKAFYSCGALETVDATNAASIGEETFADCAVLETVDAQSATSVGKKAFFLCPELADVDIQSATTVGEAAFFQCTKLWKLNISNLSSVGVEAFAYVGTDSGITTYNYSVAPSALSTVYEGAFVNSKLFDGKALSLSSCSVYEAAFAGTGFASLTLNGCTVGKSAFSGTTTTGNVTASDAASTIGTGNDNETVFGAANYTFTNGTVGQENFVAASFGKLIVSASSTQIKKTAFQGVTFDGMEISGSSVAIGVSAFQNATIRNTAGNKIYVTGSNVSFGANAFQGATLTGIPIQMTGSSTNVTIGVSAFASTSFDSLWIGGSGANVKNSAFKSTTIAGNVTISGASATIGETAAAADTGAFSGAAIGGNLSITGGGTVNPYAFHGATVSGANGVTIGSENAGATEIKGHAFAGATFGKLIMNTSTVNITGEYAFAAGDSYVDLYPHEAETTEKQRDHTLTTVNASATVITGHYAFCDRAGISNLTFPTTGPTSTATGTYAFRGCTGLGSSISVPASWEYLPDGTFYCCDGIQHLTLPSVTHAGNYIFSSRGASDAGADRTTITFGVCVSTISPHAFASYNPNPGNAPEFGRDDVLGPFSYLEIHLEQTPMYSVSGWNNGWDAWKIEDTHYWIFWAEIIEEYNLGSIFESARIVYKKDGGNYIVIGSKNDTHVDIYTYIGQSGRHTEIGTNGTPVHTEYAFAYDANLVQNIPAVLQNVTAEQLQANPKAYGVIKALGKRIVGEDGEQKYFFYYVHTEIGRTVADDIDSWDYRYSLLRHENNFTESNTIEQEQGFFSPPAVGESGTAYLSFSNGKFRYDFDLYLKDAYSLGTGTGKYNVTTIKETTDTLPEGYNRAFQIPSDAETGFNKIFVPDTVTEIGTKAFYGEKFLVNLTGETVSGSTYTPYDYPALHLTAPVGTSAFEGCTALTQIDFDAGTDDEPHLTTIGEASFKNCTSLATLGLTRAGNIGTSAFQGCSVLPSLTFTTVGNIGASAFESAFTSGANKTITINGLSNTDISIGRRAFRGANKLQALTFGDDVTGSCTLGDHAAADNENNAEQLHGAFYNCDALTTVNWGGLTSVDIGAYTFYDCDALGTVNWKKDTDNTVISFIGRKAFYDCGSLQSVTIGQLGSQENPAKIDASAFRQSRKLKTFAVEGGYVSEIGYAAFWDTFSDTSVNNGDGGSFTMSAPVELLGVVDSNNIAYTFGNTPYLKAIAFIAVGKVNSGAFYFNNNENLTGRTLTIDTLGVEGYDPDGVGTAEPGDGLLADNALLNGRFETITISAGNIPTIGAGAFTGNGELKNVTLPTVGTLGASAFKGCPKLETVTFDSVNTISSYAFSDSATTNASYCTSLKSVTMPGVETIGDHAFYKAGASSGVTALVWPADEENGLNATLKTIGASAFEECKLLGTVEVPGGTGVSVGNCAFKASSVTEVTFQNNPPETAGSYWFENCMGLTKVEFQTEEEGSNWTTIPNGTFKGCANLGSATNESGESVDFGSITTIGSEAFMNTGAASSVTRNTNIPDTIQVIGASAFENCKFLDDADLSGVSSEGGIGDKAFMGSTVGELTLPANYDGTAGVSAFEGCANLGETDGTQKTLAVPHGWSAIPNSMFANTGLTDVTIGEENENTGVTINAYAFSGCTALTEVTIYGAAVVGDSAFSSRMAGTGVTELPAPFAANAKVTMDQVKTIGASAFFNCANLVEVNMAVIESIDDNAFMYCTNLERVNYKDSQREDGEDEMLLMKHNSFRAANAGYTGFQAEEQSYLYHYGADDEAWMSYNERTEETGVNHNWKFSMCTLPNTLHYVGEYAFSGNTKITDLYIADIKLSTVSINNSQLDEAAYSAFDDNAFSGMQSLEYIFIQHGFHMTSGAPWIEGDLGELSVEWDDGIIGDPETGLYYNYQTGMIVGVYKRNMTVLDNFPEGLIDGRGLKDDLPVTGINTNTFFMGNNIRDIEIPAWVLERIIGGTFIVEGNAFVRLIEDELLRISLLGFFQDDLAEQIAAGFGFVIPDDASYEDSITDKIDDELTAAELIELFGGTDTDGDGIPDVPGVDTDGDGDPDSFMGGLIGKLDPSHENGALGGLVEIISSGGTVNWEDVVEALLGYQGLDLDDLLEHLGGTVDPEGGTTWEDILEQISDGTIECSWEDIFELIVGEQNAKVEWLEQPVIDFGGKLANGTPRVGYEIEIQEDYPIGGERLGFQVNEFSGTVNISEGLPKKVTLIASDVIQDAPAVNGVQTASAQLKFAEFDAAINRENTYWDGTRYSAYRASDTDYRNAIGETVIGDPVPDSIVSESHIFKLTADESGLADYLTLYDTIYCRVTFTRDNRRDKANGTQNQNYSINYTTVYDFFSPYLFDERDGVTEENSYKALVDDESIADYFAKNSDGEYEYADYIVPNISFKGVFAEPKELFYDLNAQRAINIANEAFELTGEDAFTADNVSFAAGMLPEVWMTAAFETRVQGGVPTCQKTVTVNGEEVTYSLAFAGWSTKQDDDSVNDETPAPIGEIKRQFNQPYERVKAPSTPPAETTLYAVWKLSETKDIWVKYGDSANLVYLPKESDPTTYSSTTTPFNDASLKPNRYSYNFNGFGSLPEMDNGISHMLTTAEGEYSSELTDASTNSAVWTNVYSKYVMKVTGISGYKWVNVQMKHLLAAWTVVSDAPMEATIKLYNGGTKLAMLYTKYNDPELYTDEACTIKVQDDANWSWPLSTDPDFAGWFTSEEYGLCVIEKTGTLCQGASSQAGGGLLNGWYGGANGWTIGNWVVDGNSNTWTVPRWVATGNRVLYAQFYSQQQGN